LEKVKGTSRHENAVFVPDSSGLDVLAVIENHGYREDKIVPVTTNNVQGFSDATTVCVAVRGNKGCMVVVFPKTDVKEERVDMDAPALVYCLEAIDGAHRWKNDEPERGWVVFTPAPMDAAEVLKMVEDHGYIPEDYDATCPALGDVRWFSSPDNASCVRVVVNEEAGCVVGIIPRSVPLPAERF
jgi:hypothetical protein